MSKFDELAAAAKQKLNDAREAEKRRDEQQRKSHTEANVAQLKSIFESVTSADVREELRPIYTADDRGRGSIKLQVGDSHFAIELDVNYYRDSTNPIYVTTAGKEKRQIGTLYFEDQPALVEARLIDTLHSYLKNPSGHFY